MVAATLLYTSALSLLVGTPLLQQHGAAIAPALQHRLPAVVAQMPAEKAYTARETPPVLVSVLLAPH